MPVISIIVPVYNVEKYLHCCLDSILAQTFTDFECILVDDGSSDNSPAICDEYAAKDSRFVVMHQRNMGSSVARNAGLDTARGAWIGFVDSDDWIECDMIEKMLKKTITDNCDMVWCDYYEDYPDHEKYIKNSVEGLDKTTIIKKMLSGKLHSSLCNKIVKKDIYTDNHIQFPRASQMEDFVVTIQNVYDSLKIGYVGEALYHYRFNVNSLSWGIERARKRIEESYENLSLATTFLQEKYGDKLHCLEPELSNRTNIIKIQMLQNRETRDIHKLFVLNSDSHKHILDKQFTIHPLSKLFLFLATKGIVFPYKVMDVLLPYDYSVSKRLKKYKPGKEP